MSKRTRRKFSAQEKVAILKRHLLEGQSVSDVCDAHGLNPTQFYRWQTEFFENGAAAFARIDKRAAQAEQRRQGELESKLKKKDAVIAEIMEDLIAEKKGRGGALSGVWVQPDVRDRIVDFVRERAAQTELPAAQLVAWIGISARKFFDWKRRYGRVNEHNAWIPRDHWLEDWEKRAVVDFYQAHPDDGYRRVTYMMMDADIVAASPSSVYRALSEAGVLRRWEPQPSKKGTGFVQPAGGTCALAHRRVVPEYLRDFLLSVQPARWLQPVHHRPPRDSRADDRAGCRDHRAACPGGLPRGAAADYFGQWSAVYRQ